jgi:hypothetical protein
MSLKAALKRSQNPDLLHVAHPRGRNTQQTPLNVQHRDATTVQHETLKASNDAASQRNTATQQQCNNAGKTMQQTEVRERPFVARVVALESGARRWWPLRLPDGSRSRLVAPGGCSRERALDAATFRWPGATIDDDYLTLLEADHA